ncbi:MAG: hypothetical protein LBL57_06020 [Tannerella sp.]|jgi:hypothetical protein|nr:hypothetical protein [Tannerella sp.]
MDIIKLEGEDRRLYDLVAHLVMNGKALAYNLNYPYRTSSNYNWFVATDGDGGILGFIPVKLGGGRAKINNYYVANDDSDVFSALLKELVDTLSPDYEIESVTQLRHISNFECNRFTIVHYWKKYAKMKLKVSGDEEKRL